MRTEESRQAKRKYIGDRPRWMALTLILLAFALRFWELGSQSLWYDEAFCWWAASEIPLAKSIDLSVREIVPPLNYLVLRGWIALAGDTEFALRTPSALIGCIAVAATGRIAWRLTRQNAGGLAAIALSAIAPPLLWASREVRLYSYAQGFTLLSGMALLETLFAPSKRQRRWAWIWGLSTLAALYTLVLNGFWLIGQGVFAILVLARWDKKRRATWLNTILLPGALAAGLFLPWFLAALGAVSENAGYWPGHLPLATFIHTAIRGMTVGKLLPETLSIVWGGLILLLVTGTLVLTKSIPWAGLYPLCSTLPALLLLALIYRNVPKWSPRHALIFAPYLFLALAIAWGMLQQLARSRTQRWALMLMTLITALVSLPLLQANVNLYFNPAYAHEDWRGTVAYVHKNRQPGDVVIIQTGSVFPTWLYYAKSQSSDPITMLPLPQEELLNVNNVSHYKNTAPLLTEVLNGAQTVWVVDWLADVTDPSGIATTLLADLGTEQIAPDFHGLELRHFTIQEGVELPPDPPTTAQPDIEMLPNIHLWGYKMPEAPFPADKTFEVWGWWTTPDPEAHQGSFYQVSLRVHDKNEEIWLRVDSTPGGGDFRPENWPAHTPILGRYPLKLPEGTPPGQYTLTLTLYKANTTHTLELGDIHVSRPTAIAKIPAHLTMLTSKLESAPLQLRAMGLNRTSVKPCESLSGLLFWEVLDTPDEIQALQVNLGLERYVTSVIPDFSAQNWAQGDRFLSKFRLPISCRALDTEAPVTITLLGQDKALGTWQGEPASIEAQRNFEPPSELTPYHADVGPDVAELLGYTLTPSPLRANTAFTLTLTWKAGEATDIPYTVFVHITPPDTEGPVLEQHDAWPNNGQRATFTWVPNEIIADAHPLLPLEEGNYTLRVGMYGPDGLRLPIQLESATTPQDTIALPLNIGPE